MQCSLNFDKLINANPKLKYDDILKMPLCELMQLQQKLDDEQQKQSVRGEKQHEIYRKVYLLFDELSQYVPEEVLFKILDTVPISYIYTENSHVHQNSLSYYLFYYVLKEYKNNDETFYDIAVPYHSQAAQCTSIVFKGIFSYYYPLFELIKNEFSCYSVESIFDTFSIVLRDNNMSVFYLKVALIDILKGDICNIINTNVSDLKENATDDEKKAYRKRHSGIYNSNEFLFFIDIIKNRRNPDAVLLQKEVG